MGAAFFYHLTESPAEAALLMLLPRALHQGWRVEVRGRDRASMEAIDLALWSGAEESFLAHGLAGGAQDAAQPVLLTFGQAAGNSPSCVMTVGGATVTPEEVMAAERVCVLFDGHDPAAVDTARGQWRTLTGAGCAAQYWAQDNGRWVRKAES